MRHAELSLIVSTYQNPSRLEKVFAGLARQTTAAREILVADDGSTEPTRHLIEAWRAKFPCPLLHVWHEDIGFRKTTILNKSIAQASGNYIVFLDGDCVPHPEFIHDHRDLAEIGFWVQGRRAFIVESWVPSFSPGETSVASWILRGRLTGLAKALRWPVPLVQRNTKQRGIIGCNMGFWRDDLVQVNGLDEEYSGWGIGEDSDLGTRLYHLGRPRKFVHGRAIVYHLNHPFLPRDHVGASRARLQETISSGKIRCAKGLNQYLAPANSSHAG